MVCTSGAALSEMASGASPLSDPPEEHEAHELILNTSATMTAIASRRAMRRAALFRGGRAFVRGCVARTFEAIVRADRVLVDPFALCRVGRSVRRCGRAPAAEALRVGALCNEAAFGLLSCESGTGTFFLVS